jgi:hypothetical protein
MTSKRLMAASLAPLLALAFAGCESGPDYHCAASSHRAGKGCEATFRWI